MALIVNVLRLDLAIRAGASCMAGGCREGDDVSLLLLVGGTNEVTIFDLANELDKSSSSS